MLGGEEFSNVDAVQNEDEYKKTMKEYKNRNNLKGILLHVAGMPTIILNSSKT